MSRKVAYRVTIIVMSKNNLHHHKEIQNQNGHIKLIVGKTIAPYSIRVFFM